MLWTDDMENNLTTRKGKEYNMKESLSIKILAASFVLAMAFIFSCQSKDDGGVGGGNSEDWMQCQGNRPGCGLPWDWCENYPYDGACLHLVQSSSSVKGSSSSSSIWEEVTQSSSSKKEETEPSSSSAKVELPSSSSKGEEKKELCKIGETKISKISFGQNYEPIEESFPDGLLLSDNCKVPGEDGLEYFTLPNGKTQSHKNYSSVITEDLLCSNGVTMTNSETDALEYWKIKAEASLCEQWRNEGRIQE